MNLDSWTDEPVQVPERFALAATPGEMARNPIIPDFGAIRSEQFRRAAIVADRLGKRPKDGWSDAHLEKLVVKLAPIIPGLRYKRGSVVSTSPAPRSLWQAAGKVAGRPRQGELALQLLLAVEGLKCAPDRRVHSDAEALRVIRRERLDLISTSEKPPQTAQDKTLKHRLTRARVLMDPFATGLDAAAEMLSQLPAWDALNQVQKTAYARWALVYWRLVGPNLTFEEFAASPE